VRTTLWPSANGQPAYKGPACPDFCLERVSPKPKKTQLYSTHQLVISSEGLSQRPCIVVTSYDGIEQSYYNTTVCEGVKVLSTDKVPSTLEFGRVGGTRTSAFFVAPVTAQYIFNARFDDGGELWMSPNADPRAAVRLLSVTSLSLTSQVTSGSDAASELQSSVNPVCADWSCVGERCFRAFGGHMTADNAAGTCKSFGGLLANPRTKTENDVLKRLVSKKESSYYIGMNDRSMEGHFKYSDGSNAGSAYLNDRQQWSYSNWASDEPNDFNNLENCAVIYSSGLWNDRSCFSTLPFMCEVEFNRGCAAMARSTDPIPMLAGETRFFEVLGYNNANADMSLITATITSEGSPSFTTSDVVGLSAEFFREIRADASAINLTVNGFAAACGPLGVTCDFSYSNDLTPRVDSIQPTVSLAGVTLITVTGSGFSKHPQLNTVDIGGALCVGSTSNDTYIICTISKNDGTAGTFIPVVSVYNLGRAMIAETVKHTILMTIDSVYPMIGSPLGGTTITITGSGFARFGLYNQITLRILNDTKSSGTTPSGSHDMYDDDWHWGRGNVRNVSYQDVLCIPRTKKNMACRRSVQDAGYDCTQGLAWAYDSTINRDSAEWFDFSTASYIECDIESLVLPLRSGSLASINISIVNTTVLTTPSSYLMSHIRSATRNFNCHSSLSHCEMMNMLVQLSRFCHELNRSQSSSSSYVSRYGQVKGWFGEDLVFSGASFVASMLFQFSDSALPVITHINPEVGIPGQLISLHGYNLESHIPLTDTNWYPC
jgi:hypothetical protein